jgi:hypothetical protein
MIPVNLSQLLLLTLAFGLSVFIICWVVMILRRGRHLHRQQQSLITCRICGVCYEYSTHSAVSQCPVCATPNESEMQDTV